MTSQTLLQRRARAGLVTFAALALTLSACEYRPDRNAGSSAAPHSSPSPDETDDPGTGESINPTICPTEQGLTPCGLGPTNQAPRERGGFKITTFAGSGSRTWAAGPAAEAGFVNPIGVAIGRSGTVYVADDSGHRVIKITSAGVVSSLSGTGKAGFTNGPAASATFNRPRGLAVAADGTVFVADTGNHAIRAISPAGVVSTVAGSGKPGLKNAPGTGALFNAPVGLTLSADGSTLYMTEFDNHAVRIVSRTGKIVRSLAGGVKGFADGAGTAAKFNSPVGIAVNKAGVVFVADAGNNRIRKIEKGSVSTFAGQASEGFKDGAGKAARFNLPYGLTIDTAGNLFATEFANNSIRKIDVKGAVTTLITPPAANLTSEESPSPSPSPTASASPRPKRETLLHPAGIVWVNGVFYVADSSRAKIRLISN